MGGEEEARRPGPETCAETSARGLCTCCAAPRRASRQPVKAGKPRIDCIDGCQFALVVAIVASRFVRCGAREPWPLRLLPQESVLAGGFFLTFGYASGYVGTKMGERVHEQRKLSKPELFFWQRVMSYYPLHALVSTIFLPLFVLLDRGEQCSWRASLVHGILNYSMLQACLPSEAHIWNPPTWFLSALTFTDSIMPTVVLPQVAKLSKSGVRKLFYGLGVLSIVQQLFLSQAWRLYGTLTGRRSSAAHWLARVARLQPCLAPVEVIMGVAAVRDVMLDNEDGGARRAQSPLPWLLASCAALGLRAARPELGGRAVRSTCFVPLYAQFLKATHRDRLARHPSALTRLLTCRLASRLGALALPMFILHGPVGQLFYRRAIATRLWGRVMPKTFFPAYLLLVLVLSHLLNEGFVKNIAVQCITARASRFLACRTRGMLQDKSQVVPKKVSFHGLDPDLE